MSDIALLKSRAKKKKSGGCLETVPTFFCELFVGDKKLFPVGKVQRGFSGLFRICVSLEREKERGREERGGDKTKNRITGRQLSSVSIIIAPLGSGNTRVGTN